MAHLLIRNLHKTYSGAHEGVAALRGISLSVERGELIALWGPSGCGKSTLLHIVGGMDRPTSGSVQLDGQALEQLDRRQLAILRRRSIGFVFQAFHLLPTLTVTENVALPLTLDGLSQSEAHRRAEDVLEQVGLAARRHSYPAQLSGGEMQRAAVARAVVNQPALLLADEPTGSLDSENGERVLQLIEELNRKLGITVLLATHSPEAAQRARRVVRMRDGLLEDSGSHERISASL